MLTPDQLRICDELVELYKAQLKLVEVGTPRDWTEADLENYDHRAERIASLQKQFIGSVAIDSVILKMSRSIPSGSWRDR